MIESSVLSLVGDTPLVRLNRLADGLRATIALKLEMINPGGSIKDRIGIRMIEEAEKSGELRPGGTIVEPTSGNTGVGLAMTAAVKGYHCIFVLPDKVSEEKIALLRAYGAEVVVTPSGVPHDSPESYYGVAKRLARTIPGAYLPFQYFNPTNPQSHYESTGPEIWRESEGRVTHLVAGIGTGGTISGTARYLKERNPGIRVVGADPSGSIYSDPLNRHPYRVEGIGKDFYPGTYDPSVIDEVIQVEDVDSFQTARRLAREEGILAGGSAGTAVWAALQLAAREDRSDALIVVILPDSGRGYLSKIFNDEWMQANGYLSEPVPAGRGSRWGDLLRQEELTFEAVLASLNDD
ncbi:MAG TPA: cysteine synthase [Thermomicrobiaceae bacterium]|nr:cysteine synthase [Thermomicrobiaceae bacterium]